MNHKITILAEDRTDTSSIRNAGENMAQHFYGYGRWTAPYWFIGPEQGQGKDESNDLTVRVKAWKLEGGPELADLGRYHDRISPGKWTSEGTPLQQTWRKLMLILHSFKGELADKESLRSYQRTKLGREQGDTCLLELGGLAAHSFKVERDRSSFREPRTNRMAKELMDRKPQFVVMYGKSHQEQYERVAGQSLMLDVVVQSGSTAILLTRHPNARGLTDEYWCSLGRKLSTAITHYQTRGTITT